MPLYYSTVLRTLKICIKHFSGYTGPPKTQRAFYFSAALQFKRCKWQK